MFQPQPGPQSDFIDAEADITVYGGAAGGGKTYGLLIDPIVKGHTDNPDFGGVIFRRVSEHIRAEGGLWDNSSDVYPKVGAKGRSNYLDWTFPSGSTVTLDSIQHEKNIYDFQGAQICYLAFDELTHFTERQFWYLVSRNRSTCGIKPYIRATLNPDPDSWVFELLGPWVNEDHPLYPIPSGEVLWFVRENDEMRWVPQGTENAKSLTFIAANIYDNRILLEKDPGYLTNLAAQNESDKERLLHGRWTAIQAKGALWKREQIERDRIELKDLPPLKRTVVGLDPSASAGPDSDEAGIVVVGQSKSTHLYTLEDQSGILTPNQWAKRAIDLCYKWGAACIVAEKNNGGEMISTVIHAIDPSIVVKLIHAKVAKKIRAEPVASAAEAGFDHHVGRHKALEGQLTRWEPDVSTESPDRLDAKVLACLELGVPERKATTSAPQTAQLPSHLLRADSVPEQGSLDSEQRFIPPPRRKR